MNIHEYQGKTLFKQAGVKVQNGIHCKTVVEALSAYDNLDSKVVAVKSQIHAGGRGKGNLYDQKTGDLVMEGGVKIAFSRDDVETYSSNIIGRKLVTKQTGPEGKIVNNLYIEAGCSIAHEYYLALLVDREAKSVLIMASTEGGVNIEEVAENTPQKIFKIEIDPIKGTNSSDADKLSTLLGLDEKQSSQFRNIYEGIVRLFLEKDLALLEVNPLVVTEAGDLLCLDAKINVDSNALYRQGAFTLMRGASQEDEREAKAAEWDLSYVALDGNIGCMVNGAGLAMGTMDIIKLHGGEPANFLDVGGTADSERVSEAFKIILSDENVNTVLINIFGGIVRCDVIANGIVEALTVMGVSVPVVVRLEGNNAEVGLKTLDECDLNIIPASSLEEAADLAVKASRGEL